MGWMMSMCRLVVLHPEKMLLTCNRIFPIDDYYECLLRGRPKEVRFMPNKKHMGEPESFVVIIKWLYELLGLEGNPVDQAKMLPFQPKY